MTEQNKNQGSLPEIERASLNDREKQLSNPFSTGGGGPHFESNIQASFVLLMLTGGCVPCLPCHPIKKIKVQGRFAGFQTDDVIVFTQGNSNDECHKLLGQIKHSIKITNNNSVFSDVIFSAWKDFNNPEIFTQGKDVLALITGPLSATDTYDVRTILEWARDAENASELFEKVEKTHFSSDTKRKRLDAFRTNIKKAAGNNDVSDDEVFEFLKHFHLVGYDLDIKSGVTLALLHSLIGQYSHNDVWSIWGKLIHEVQSANQNAGTISLDNISDEIRAHFRERKRETMPPEFNTRATQRVPQSSISQEKAETLVYAVLLGGWREDNESDVAVVKSFVDDFDSWMNNARDILQEPDSPLILKNGYWRVIDRTELWVSLGPRVFDTHLDKFESIAIKVLSEIDSQFDMPAGERYAASIYGKILKFSPQLRRGVVEALALLGNRSDTLSHCSKEKPSTVVFRTINAVFENADWQLWGSLNDLLPEFAEASPPEFLNVVEQSLRVTPCPFDELFAQEGTGYFGGTNYLTGLLWALEGLAWSEDYLVRVSVMLTELATRDPGGQWRNRPVNSLTEILLPWYPQTLASFEKRIVVIKTIQREAPPIAWKLLINLLPNQYQISSGTHKPKWCDVVSQDWVPKVTNEDYWFQITEYAKLTVEMACDDFIRLSELVKFLDQLPEESFAAVLEHLSTDYITNLSEEERMPLWLNLTDFTRKHRRFSTAKWALSGNEVTKIETVAEILQPQSLEGRYQRYFSNEDYQLYDENGNWEEQRENLEDQRNQAVREIFEASNLEGVINFIDSVKAPESVGRALGTVADNDIDSQLLPAFLSTESEKYQEFIRGFVWSRYQHQEWRWVDTLDRTDWNVQQSRQLLVYLPFDTPTWKRVTEWLNDSESLYWQSVPVDIHQADSDPLIAIDKFLDVSRPHAAIRCLYYRLFKKYPLDIDRTVKALLDAVNSPETVDNMDVYHIQQLIEALQNNSETDQDDLFSIEWAYLQILDSHSGINTTVIKERLANDPEAFCEIIRMLYRSEKTEVQDEENKKYPKSAISNAWELLRRWDLPPGLHQDGNFSENEFNAWYDVVSVRSEETGHLEIAVQKVGEVLFYAPPDPKGLWIMRSVAEVLNASDADRMRRGFQSEIFNSRGVHTIDPSGKPERDLAAKWRERANEIENEGFSRFAATLREVSESYEREAESVIDRHGTFEDH